MREVCVPEIMRASAKSRRNFDILFRFSPLSFFLPWLYYEFDDALTCGKNFIYSSSYSLTVDFKALLIGTRQSVPMRIKKLFYCVFLMGNSAQTF